jgi:hypothetical protein
VKFFTRLGELAKARRFQNASASVQDDDVTDPVKLAKVLRSTLLRLTELESRIPPESLEFEVHTGIDGALTTIAHNVGGPIRWWVTDWMQQDGVAYPVKAPQLVQDATSTSSSLVLRSYKAGRAIVRIEPAVASIDPGITVATSPTYGAETMAVSGLRLTLATATPVTATDQATKSTIYYTPYISGQVRLYYGSEWTVRTTTEISIALSGLTAGRVYDVFAYWTGTAVALELSAAWATAATRTDALAYVHGVLTKSSDSTRLYVGSFYTSSISTTDDTINQRCLWNMYNRVPRYMVRSEATDNWTYVNPNQVWRMVRGTGTGNSISYVCGEVGVMLDVQASAVAVVSAGASYIAAGVGIDSETVNSAVIRGGGVTTATSTQTMAIYKGYPALGYHVVNWLETGQVAAATYTFLGDNGTTMLQSGMYGEILG